MLPICRGMLYIVSTRSFTRGGGPDWGLNPGPPALEARTLPLGYRGGGPDWGLNLGPPALEASTLPLGYRSP